MRKARSTILLVLVMTVASLGMLAAPALAHQGHPLMSNAVLSIGPNDDHWSGTIAGDVRGTMQMTGLDVAYPVEIVFTEGFSIVTRAGDIEGYVIGIFPGPDFSSCGWVTSATGRWSAMDHWMMYQSGEVTESEGTYVARSYVVFMPPFPMK